MSRKNTITVEFVAIGDGLDRIEKSLRGIELVDKKLKGTTGLSTLTSQLKLAERGAAQVASGLNLLPSGASASVGAFAGLTQAMSQMGAAGGLVGVVLAATALEFAVVTAAAFKAGEAFVSFAQNAIGKGEELKRAQLGVESVARFKGIDPEAANEAVRNLEIVKNGLISVADASTALKNLLQTGFNLEQSVDIIKAFGDSAAYGRQQSLTFGYAIVSATEGVRNGNSVLSDNAGVTKNLSLILKEAGFQMQDLADRTKGANARQALYAGLVAETAAQTGNAAEYAETYSGKLSKIDAAYTILIASLGEFLSQNQGLNDVLDVLSNGLTALNAHFDEVLLFLKLLTPLIRLAVGVVQLFVDVLILLGYVTAGAVAALGGLEKVIGVITRDQSKKDKGNEYIQLAKDISALTDAAAKASLKLPNALSKLTAPRAKSAGFGELIRPAIGVLKQATDIRTLVRLTNELQAAQEKQAAAQALALERHTTAFRKQLELERERTQLVERTRITEQTLGLGAAQADLATQLAKIEQDGEDRLDKEIGRLIGERAALMKKLIKEKDPAAREAIKAAIADVTAAAIAFRETNAQFVDTQQQAARIDFASKLADQLQAVNTKMFDLTQQIEDDNPFVAIFRDAGKAIFEFDQQFGDLASQVTGFADKIAELTDKRVQAATAAGLIRNFDLQRRQQLLANQFGIGPSRDAEDLNRNVFELFDRLRFQGDEAAKKANEFLIQAFEGGTLDVSLLTTQQAQVVFQAYTDLQKQLDAQKREAQVIADAEKAERDRIENERRDEIRNLTNALIVNAEASNALNQTIKDKNLVGEILIDVADGLTADPVTPQGLGTP